MKKYPLLFTLLILFLFFLPLRSVEIPSILVGFSLNFSRLFIVLATLVLFMNICINQKYFNKIFNTHNSNPYIQFLLIYFMFSILYYYISLSLNKTVLFGGGDFFFRSWKGRPIGQFLSFISYAIIPYYLVKKYAEEDSKLRVIERTIVVSTIFLLYYGYLQQVLFHLGLPVTGRILGEGIVPAFLAQGIENLRFYSLAGEPRDFGGFIIGAILFYWYYCYGRTTLFSKISIFLMIIAFGLTASTSSYAIFCFAIIAIIIDFLFLSKVRINIKFVKYVSGFLFLTIILFLYTDIDLILGTRTIQYIEAFAYSFGNKSVNVPVILTNQSVDIAIIPYLINIANTDILNILFGSGYGNFLSPVHDILLDSFNRNIALDPNFADSRSYAIKLFIECGVIGSSIFLMMLFYVLKLNKKLIRLYRNKNRSEYYKMLILRYAFIVFCVSGAIQTSFYYFIIMGIIIGKYNSVINFNKRSSYGVDLNLMEKSKS